MAHPVTFCSQRSSPSSSLVQKKGQIHKRSLCTHTQNSQNRLLLLFRFSRINLCVLIVNKKTKKKFPAIICGLCCVCALLAHKQTSKQKTKTKNEKKETSTWKENEDEWRNWIIFTLTFSLLFIHFFSYYSFMVKVSGFVFYLLFCFVFKNRLMCVFVCVPGTTTTTTKLLRVDNNKRFAIFFLFVHQSCFVEFYFGFKSQWETFKLYILN